MIEGFAAKYVRNLVPGEETSETEATQDLELLVGNIGIQILAISFLDLASPLQDQHLQILYYYLHLPYLASQL